MKVIILNLGLMLILSSCGPSIYFEQPQPTKGKKEEIFPKAWQGKYIDNNNKGCFLNIYELTLEYIDNDYYFDTIKASLSDSLILKQQKPYYILNALGFNGWEVMAITIKNDTLLVKFTDGEHLEEVEKLKKITPVKKIVDSTGRIDYYLINPTQRQFESMLKKKMFPGEMIFTIVNK